MNIFFSEIHMECSKSLATAILPYGNLLLADATFDPYLKYTPKHTNITISDYPINTKLVSYQEFMDNPPDIIIITSDFVEEEMLNICKNIKTVHYCVNNNMCFKNIKNLITSDITTFNRYKNKNSLLYYPHINYDRFHYSETSDEIEMGTYINGYEKFWVNSFNIYKSLINITSDIMNYKQYEHVANIENHMKKSMATLHVKEFEGYGFSIIQSMAMGRPVFLYKTFSYDKSYTNWAIEGESAIYFDSLNEYVIKLTKLIRDDEYRYNIQKSTAVTVRKIINNDEQDYNLEKFLKNI